MEENKVVQLSVNTESATYEPEMKTSEMSQIVSLSVERKKRFDFTPEPENLPTQLSNFDDQTKQYLKGIIENKIKASQPTTPISNTYVSLTHVLGLDVCDNIAPDDPIYQQASYMDSLLKAIASDIGEKNISKLSDAIGDMLRGTLELGKFIKLVEDDSLN